jgi:hypothetical protein
LVSKQYICEGCELESKSLRSLFGVCLERNGPHSRKTRTRAQIAGNK